MAPRVWLITGCSSGFGAELVKYALQQGDYVVATARKPESLDSIGVSSHEDRFLKVRLDVQDTKSIDSAFQAAIERFHRLDVVVNNAGYGLSGPFEELEPEKIRHQFDVNFFGLLDVTRVAMRVMREQGTGGLIQNVTSIGGLIGVPTFSIYCATKWAIEGFTAAVNKEVKEEWKIRLQCVEPSGFRTRWSGAGMIFADQRHPAYDHIDSRSNASSRDQTQNGDPVKGARAMYLLATMEDPPKYAVIGSDAQNVIETKIQEYTKHYCDPHFKQIATSCDVDK